MEKEEKTRQIDRQIEKLSKQLDQIQRQLSLLTEELKKQGKMEVQNLVLDRPRIDQLTYRLDQLEINELSGMLNIGNTFGLDRLAKKGVQDFNLFSALAQEKNQSDGMIHPNKPPSKKQKGEETVKIQSMTTDHTYIEKSERGYRITMYETTGE